MTQARWEQLYDELQRKADRIGYKPPRDLGQRNSQSFEFKWKGRPVLLIAFRDLAQDPNYAVPDRLWAEGLDLIEHRYAELAAAAPGGSLPAAIALVIDNLRNAYIVVTLNELLELRRERARNDPNAGDRLTFVVLYRPEGYLLRMPAGGDPVPLTEVNSIESIVLLLKTLKQ